MWATLFFAQRSRCEAARARYIHPMRQAIQRLAIGLLAGLAFMSAPSPARADRYLIEFDGAVLGVLPLGGVTLDLFAHEGRYQARGVLKSGGLLALFDPTDLTAKAQGALGPGGASFEAYELDHYYAKKHRTIAMRRDETGLPVADIRPTFREWGEPPASEAHKRESVDPLTALVAMSADVAAGRGCARTYPTFDGRFRYDLVLSAPRQSSFKARDYSGTVLRCDLTYVPVAGFNPRNENERRRYPTGEIWFALNGDPDLAPPVRVLVPMGLARAGLTLRSLRRVSVSVESQ